MRRIGVVLLVAAPLAALGGCGASGDVDAEWRPGGDNPVVSSPATADVAAAPTTDPPARSAELDPSITTTASTSTTAAPTTTATATAPPALPVPVEPPREDGSTEPRVEIGSIEIPRIGVARNLLEGIRMSTLNSGPGHWPGTALPGELGNVVIAGHRVSYDADFRDLDQLVAGDEVIFTTMSGRHVYRVVRTEIVGPDAVWIVSQTADHTGTLFACHPPGSTRQRIVVHLDLVA